MNVKEWNEEPPPNETDGWVQGHLRRSYAAFYNG